ncbi:amidase [Amycolatopsis taiwanensis]|uniref:Amidohydrolase n=1 Tax=Amycolatopsis taiwanensis TaxID=342230 RepID=A0A9W6QSP6_9PSEU|nr:amidase [Amycolatopsis taiwanensis]GLY63559.1 amidohydrolase [Amycolatopsis taiwanensis]
MSSSLETSLDPPPGAGYFARVGVAELATELRAGRVSSRDLVETALGEAARWQPVLNAFVTIDETGARAAAEKADRELAAGVDRGPLHGLPIAVKDIIDVHGLPTTAGARHFAGHIASRDADCIRPLREAGAVILGKTTTHEFACGPTGDRSASGPTRNPYATGHMAGGSSSGSAAAVAAGIVGLALGTDTGGSVRIPAACCGVVGLKPTHGAVATTGVFPLAPSLDTVGPLARTAADCRLLWTVMTAGHRQPVAAPRIGWVPPDSIHPTAPEITSLARDLTKDLIIGEVTVPAVKELRAAYRTIQGSEAYAVHAERLATAPELYGDEVRDRLRTGGQARGWEYVRALELRDRVRGAVTDLLRQQDFLALPTIPLSPPTLDSRDETIGGEAVDVRAALLALTSPWSVLGLPAVTVPAGLVDGLPVGLQLVGPPGTEHRLLTVAEYLQNTSS